MKAYRLTQSIIRLWPTVEKQEAYFHLTERLRELGDGLFAEGQQHLAVPLFFYMIANMEFMMFCSKSLERFTSQRAIGATSIVDAFKRLERNELQRIFPQLFQTTEHKVQNWLGLKVLCLEVLDSSEPEISGGTHLDLEELDMQDYPDDVDIDSDHVDHLDMLDVQSSIINPDRPDNQGSCPLMQVDEEMDECQSMVTDLRSSRFGLTYTENVSEMSGVSFNYEAIFP